jgi:ribosomal-protein-alanine N-acetyltransferase
MIHLTSHRLKYTQISQDDFPSYARLVMDEEVMKYITGKALSVEEALQRFQKALQASEMLSDAGFFLVCSRDNDELVGVTKLVQLAENQYEIGYMLLPEYWGRGFASEMTETMIYLAREKKLTGELIGIVDPENPASIRVLTKSGFELYETGQIDGLEAAYYKLMLETTISDRRLD